MNTFKVLGVKIHAVNLKTACGAIEDWITTGHKTYVCLAPVSTIVEARKDPQYQQVLNQAGMTTPDGMPLVWIGRLRGSRDIGRTYGPDLMRAFFRLSVQKGYRHFFYGASEDTIQKLVRTIERQYPGIKIAGSYSPPYREANDTEHDKILSRINESRPHVLWVGLGSPKQDYWMARHRSRLDVPVMIGVGAAFNFLAGTKPQAPLWMQKCGLEWLFRLCCEPRRLWRRYLIGNFIFVYWMVQQTLNPKRRNPS